MGISRINKLRHLTLESHTIPMSNSIMHQSRSEEKSNGKDGLKTTLTTRTSKPILLTPESLMLPLSSNSRMLQLRSEVRNNGKDGLKTTSTTKTNKLTSQTPESLMHPLSSNSRMHQLRSEEKNNGKDGL